MTTTVVVSTVAFAVGGCRAIAGIEGVYLNDSTPDADASTIGDERHDGAEAGDAQEGSVPADVDAAPWEPSLVPNQVLWLRADRGITLTDGKVSTWADQSGKGHHFTQSTSVYRPQLVASDSNYNSQPTVAFGNTHLQSSPWVPTVSQPLTVYLAFNTGSLAEEVPFWSSDFGVWQQLPFGNPPVGLAMFAGTLVKGDTTALLTPSIVCAVFAGVSSELYLSSTTPFAAQNAGTNGLGASSIRIGVNSGNGGPLTGRISEILVYGGAHDASTRKTVMRYLAGRYAIAAAGL